MAAERESLKPVYLLTGADRPKIGRALGRLRRRVGADAVESLLAGEAAANEAVAACNALGLFGGGQRLVIVHDVERWKAADARALATYLDDPAPETVLALVGDGIKREAPLAKACAKAGQVLVFDVSKRDLPRWVGEQFGRFAAQAEPAACRALVEIVGEDLDALASEVAKLAAWAGDEPVTEADVHRVATPLAETPPFALTDAWGRRDVPGVLRACEGLLENASGSRAGELTRLAGLIAGHVARVRECQALASEGLRPREAAARLKRSPFYVEKLFVQADSFTTDELFDALVRLSELDLALKGGSRVAGDLELERALIAITRAASLPSASA